RRLSPPAACAVGLAVAHALSQAHRFGIAHRDVKPANILFTGSGLPKLTDFGIAKILEGTAGEASRLAGTPRYMAPEQIRRGRLSPATDVYGLGVVLHELLRGESMFPRGLPVSELFRWHLEVEPPPLPAVPPALGEVVARALAKDPAARHPTGLDLARELAVAAGAAFGPRWLHGCGVTVRVVDDLVEQPSPPAGRDLAGRDLAGPTSLPTPLPLPTPASTPRSDSTTASIPAAVPTSASDRSTLAGPSPGSVPLGVVRPGAFRPGGFRPGGADAAAPVTPPPAVRPLRRQRLAVTVAATAATMVLGLIACLVIPGGSASSPRSGATTTAAVGDAGVTPPGPDGVAAINEFKDLTVDAAGNVYLADQADPRIRRIDRRGYVSTVAGSGETGTSGDGGPALQAAFQRLGSVAVDAAGNIYISDESNRVRRVDTHGTVTTIVGTGDDADTGDGGPAIQAALDFATTEKISVDVAGNLYICVLDGLRRVDRAGIITTLIKRGTGLSPSPPGDGGPASAGRLQATTAAVADRSGDLYIADSEANRIRRIDSRGIVTTVAGTG
ncbi:serine/threonine-protein kinase, partial [Frankia sp. AvcI1]